MICNTTTWSTATKHGWSVAGANTPTATPLLMRASVSCNSRKLGGGILMNSRSDDAIARATAERDAILAECHQLLERIARRPQYLKLLEAARIHLRILANYKRR